MSTQAHDTTEQARFREMEARFRAQNAQDQVLAGVKQARELVTLAQASGFLARVTHRTDSGDSPFMTVELAHPGTADQYTVTWHTRQTGSYRLFSKAAHEPDIDRAAYHDVPSIKYVMQRLRTANEREPAAKARAAERLVRIHADIERDVREAQQRRRRQEDAEYEEMVKADEARSRTAGANR